MLKLAVPDLRTDSTLYEVPDGVTLPVLVPRSPVDPEYILPGRPRVDYSRNSPDQELPKYRRVPNQPDSGLDMPEILKVDPYPSPALRTFTGADITCIVHVLGNGGITRPVVLANAQTLSYSIHRDKFPVRALGHTYPRGFTRGGRTIAGSIVFTMFDREILWELIQTYSMDVELNENDMEYSSYSPMVDQLPPFDITITFMNEYGDVANMALYGVEIVDEGAVLSVDDLLVEKTCSFVARDIDIVRPYANAPNFKAFGKDVTNQQVTAEDVHAFMSMLAKRRQAINGIGGAQNNDVVWMNDTPYDYALFSAVAKQDAMFPVLTQDDLVICTYQGVDWIGTATLLSENGMDYLFKPSPKIYNYRTTIASGTWVIHDSIANQMTEAQAQAKINEGSLAGKYYIPYIGVQTTRGDLRAYGKWTTH